MVGRKGRGVMKAYPHQQDPIEWVKVIAALVLLAALLFYFKWM